MTPITRESARHSVAQLPENGRAGGDWQLVEAHLDTLSDWVDAQLQELEQEFDAFRTRSSLRNSLKRGRGTA